MINKKNIMFLTITIIGGIAIYLLVSFLINKFDQKEEILSEITLDQYIELNGSQEKVAFYISSSSNEINKDYENMLLELMSDRDTKMYYLDLTKVNEDGKIVTFMNTNELTQDSFTEPMIIIMEDSKVKDHLFGVVSKTELIKFLDSNRID